MPKSAALETTKNEITRTPVASAQCKEDFGALTGETSPANPESKKQSKYDFYKFIHIKLWLPKRRRQKW
jgi:hypothetical protein